MKKITILFAALIMGSALMAQTAVIERPDNGVNSIIATQGTDAGVYIGDQFELTGDTTIGAFQIFGTNSSGADLGTLLTGLNVFIYEDVGGLPAGDPTLPNTGIVELADIDLANVIVSENGAGITNFTTNMTDANGGTEITLGAGTYWLVSFPSVSTGAGGAGRWNWALSDATPAIEPVLIDPADLFGAGLTAWTNIAGVIGAPASGMAWTLFDDAVLSVSDSTIDGLSLFPNPTNGIVNINLPASQVLENVSVFDLTGRQVMDINTDVNAVDFTSFSTGVYIARLTTTDGSIQAVRIVKQ